MARWFDSIGRMLDRMERTQATWVGGAVTAVALIIAACTDPVEADPVGSVQFVSGIDSVEIGLVDSGFTLVVKDKNGVEITGRHVTWTSLHPDVATVAEDGKISGLTLGNATIKATVEGRSAQGLMKVIQRVGELIVQPDSFDLPLGTQKQLVAGVLDINGAAIPGRRIDWTSDNTTIAVVSPTGQVSPLAEGTTRINASVSDKTVHVKVVVLPELCSQVRITNPPFPSYQLRIGTQVQLTAVPLNAQQQVLPRQIFFKSVNALVASVDSVTGVVTGISLGSTQVVATCDDQRASANIQINVTLIPVATVDVSPSSVSILDGQSTQLTAIPKDSAGNVLSLIGRNVNWSSDNVLVASVQNTGVLTAHSKGTANVQATVDGVLSPPLPVTVTLPAVVSVQITPPSATISAPPGPGATSVQLSAILRDASGNQLPVADHPVTWTSSDSTTATVTANGFVQALKAGAVIITATCEGVSNTASIIIN